MKIDQTKSIKINGMPVVILRKSKWTYQCLTTTGEVLCSDKSYPKVTERAELVIAQKFGVKQEEEEEVKAVKKPVDPNKKKNGSIKSLVFDMIIGFKEDEAIVNAVKSIFPESKFNQAHVSWYRSTLYRDGIIGPEHAPRRTQAYKDWKKANTKN